MASAPKRDEGMRGDNVDNGEIQTSFVDAVRRERNRVEEKAEVEELELSEHPNVGSEDKDEMETLCGAGSWRPSWLQFFARAEVYALAHATLSFVIFADATYFVGTLSTVEKHLKIPSRTTGFMHSSFEIGSLLAMPVVGYAARHFNPMRLVCGGTVLTGLACLCFALPHFVFGPGSDALALAQRNVSFDNASAANTSMLLGGALDEETAAEACGGDGDGDGGGGGGGDGDSSSWTVVLFCAVNVLVGIGTSAHYTVGYAYLDNNSSKNKSPILLAATTCIQMLGSTLGYAVASMSLAYYVIPSLTPNFDNSDPRWIGAWWLGWPLMSALTVTTGCLMALFPRRLPLPRAAERRTRPRGAEAEAEDGDAAVPSAQDLKSTLLRLLRNKVLVFNTCSTMCLLFGYSSYFTFLPKYMETQYRKTASEANIITGSMSLVFTGVGMMAAAIFISRFKPGPRKIAAWNVLTELMDVVGHFSSAFLECSTQDESVDCSRPFTTFIALKCIMSFLQASGHSGNVLLAFRCVDEKDKSLSIALTQIALSILVFFPAPTIYGSLLDTTCLVWEESCGSVGNCKLYDNQKMRYVLNFTATGCLIVGVIFDIGVWMYCAELQIYEEEDPKESRHQLTDDISTDKENKSQYQKWHTDVLD